MGKVNFGIAVRLIKEGFDSGAKSIQASLNSIRMKTIAMTAAFTGASLSIGGMLNKLKEVARETGRANIALKNVSKSSGDFSNNVKFLRRLSEEFGQDIVSLTDSYAKFKAAADASGMSVEAQEKIFRSLTRTITAFGLGNQEANLSFYAISQMMAKGKISAEELRRQLGERIPTAMQAMANAAGVPISKLDDLLKQGKLLSKDIMPKFAEELEKLTINVDTDNLETSLNRQKNTLVKLAEDWDIYGKFKYVVDQITNLIEFLRTNIKDLLLGLASFSVGRYIHKRRGDIVKSWAGTRYNGNDVRNSQKASLDFKNSRRDVKSAEMAYDKAIEKVNELKKVSQDQALADKHMSQAQVGRLKALEVQKESLLRQQQADVRIARASHSEEMANLDELRRKRTQLGKLIHNEASLKKALQEHNKYTTRDTTLPKFKSSLQSQYDSLGRAIGKAKIDVMKAEDGIRAAHDKSASDIAKKDSAIADVRSRNATKLQNKLTQAEEKRSQHHNRLREAEANREQARSNLLEARAKRQASRTTNIFRRGFRLIGNSARVMGGMIKSAFSSIVFGLIISAIVGIANAIYKVVTRASRLKAHLDEIKASYRGVIDDSKNTAEILHLKDLQKELTNLSLTEDRRKEINKELNTLFGTQITSADELNKRLEQHIKLLEAKAEAEAYVQQRVQAIQDFEAKSRELVNKFGYFHGEIPYDKLRAAVSNYKGEDMKGATYKGKHIAYADVNKEFIYSLLRDAGYYKGSYSGSVRGSDSELVEALYELKTIVEVERNAEEKIRENYDLVQSSNTTTTTSKASEKDNDLQKAEEKFAEEYKALQRRLRAGVIKASEFADEQQKLAQKTREEIGGILGNKAKNNKTFQKADSLYNEDFDVVKAKAEYMQGVSEAMRLRQRGLMTDDKLISIKSKLARAEVEALLKKEKLTDADEEYLASRLAIISEDSDLAKIQRDYKAQMKNLKYQKEALNISDEDYKKAQEDLTRATLERTAKLQGLTPAQQEERNKQVVRLKEYLVEEVKGNKPKREERDKTFDFEKTKSEVFRLDAENLRKYAEALKVAQKNTGVWEEEIKKLIAEADNLDEAFKLQKLNEAISKFKGDIFKGAYNGMKNIAGSVNNLKNALDGLDKAFDPESKAGAWERFFAVFNTITQVVDSILSAIDMINNLIKVIDMMTAAEEALTTAKTIGIGVEQTKQATENAGSLNAIANAAKELLASESVTAAKTTEATAKVMSAHAGIPFVGVAIAGAMVGAMLALILSSKDSVPKFAEGGIVPGALSNGDRVLARLNPGELILNHAQQSNIAGQLQGVGSRKIEVEVTGQLRGRDVMQLTQNAVRQRNR